MGRNRGVSLCLWMVIGCGGGGGTTDATTAEGSSSSGSSTPTSSSDPPTGTAETSGITGDLSATGTTTTTGDSSTGTTSALTSTDSSTTTGGSTDDSTSTSTDDSTGASSDDSSGGSTDESTGDPPVLEPFDVIDLDAGHGHVCAVLASHQLKCWGGYNDSGGLGLGDDLPRGTTPGTMGNNLPALELGNGVSAGAVSSYYHGCVVLEDDQLLKCWGQATFGALGSGDGGENFGDTPGEMGDLLPFVDVGLGRTVVQVATGVWTTCAVLDDATAKCWGFNSYGWLGQGDQNDRGDAPGEMGDTLKPIALGAGRTVQSIGLDNSHACALLDDDTIKCWGQNSEGSLGRGVPGDIGDDPGEMGDALPAIDLGAGRTAKQLTVGARHACAILDNDQLKCWGANASGQLGLGDTNNRGDAPDEMGDKLPAVDLGAGRTAVQVAASYFHTCAILDNDDLKCWGQNSFGALGQGDTDHRGDDPGEMGDALPPIDLGSDRHAVQVAPGALYVCARLDNHKIKCWGVGGTQGALGYEDMESRGDQPGEMGDNLPFVDLGS